MLRRGFTLIELLVAMAITAILVLLIMQMTNQGLRIWKEVEEDISTSTQARIATTSVAHDLESVQMNLRNNNYEWFYAGVDNSNEDVIKGMNIPLSSQCIFFTCAMDRNPAVNSDPSTRANYRALRADYIHTQGDVNAIGYRLLYRDQIRGLDPKGSSDSTVYPIFSLYRQKISPRDAFEKLMARPNLENAYGRFKDEDEKHFLCENIIELNFVLTLQYVREGRSSSKDGRVAFETVSVPVMSTRGGSSTKVRVYGDRIEVNGKRYNNARLTAANISVTVVTDEGMTLLNQVRLNRRKAPKPADFFKRYTRSFSRNVAIPQPL